MNDNICETRDCFCGDGWCAVGVCTPQRPFVSNKYSGFGVYSDPQCNDLLFYYAYTSTCTDFRALSIIASCSAGNATINYYTGKKKF